MPASTSLLRTAVACAVLVSVSRAGEPPTFTGLGDLAGGDVFSKATGVSADGTVVCGFSTTAAGDQAFIWTATGGMVALGDLPGGGTQSHARGVSADGTTIVGDAESANGVEAFRWTAATGMVGLGDLPGAGFHSIANAVNADGTVIVGEGQSTLSGATGSEAFRWTAAGLQPLGDLPGGSFSSVATGVSADGVRVSGYGSSAASGPTGTEAFNWWLGVGMGGLGDAPGGAFVSKAFGVSADGVLFTGSTTTSLGAQPGKAAKTFEGTLLSMVQLSGLGVGEGLAIARIAAPYQEVVVGRTVTIDGPQAFMQRHSMIPELMVSMLAGLGLDLTGWSLEAATAMSPDANIIVGYGQNPSGKTEAWVAHLGNVWTDVGGGLAGVSGVPVLTAKGEGVYQHGHLLEIANAKPSTLATQVIGLSTLNAPFKGGLMVPSPDVLLPGIPIDANGELLLAFSWPHVPSGYALWLQYWIPDSAAPKGFSATNALMATAP